MIVWKGEFSVFDGRLAATVPTLCLLADNSRRDDQLTGYRESTRADCWQFERWHHQAVSASRAENNLLRPGRSATRTTGPKCTGAFPCSTLNISTASLFTTRSLTCSQCKLQAWASVKWSKRRNLTRLRIRIRTVRSSDSTYYCWLCAHNDIKYLLTCFLEINRAAAYCMHRLEAANHVSEDRSAHHFRSYSHRRQKRSPMTTTNDWNASARSWGYIVPRQ